MLQKYCIRILFYCALTRSCTFLFLGGKSIPIHCVVEQTNGPVTFDDDGSSHFTVELDSYAILPCTTPFSELVRAALVKLGYNSTESVTAKGIIKMFTVKDVRHCVWE